jgi:hypothetical protein
MNVGSASKPSPEDADVDSAVGSHGDSTTMVMTEHVVERDLQNSNSLPLDAVSRGYILGHRSSLASLMSSSSVMSSASGSSASAVSSSSRRHGNTRLTAAATETASYYYNNDSTAAITQSTSPIPSSSEIGNELDKKRPTSGDSRPSVNTLVNESVQHKYHPQNTHAQCHLHAEPYIHTPTATAAATADKDDLDIESDDEERQNVAEQRKPGSGSDTSKKWYQNGRLKFYHFKDAPRYMQDNPAIHTGYRTAYTYTENWISLFHLHNESVSIFSFTSIGMLPRVLMWANLVIAYIVQRMVTHYWRRFIHRICSGSPFFLYFEQQLFFNQP